MYNENQFNQENKEIKVEVLTDENVLGSQPNKTKQKKKLSANKISTIILASGICLSFCAGFAGSAIANSMTKDLGLSTQQSADTSQNTVIPTTSTTSGGLSVSEIAAMNQPSVVEIKTEAVQNSPFMQQYVSEGAGSGVIISDDGYIATNNHVIDGASTITVTLSDGKTYDATLIGTDPDNDLAVIKINALGLDAVTFGDSDQLIVGQDVVAIGNPLGELGGTVTDGIISATNREVNVEGTEMTLLQTNTAINPGNSGGGLFNANGELIGIVTAKSAGSDIEGLGFAIPINEAKVILDGIIEEGKEYANKPMLGVTLIDITDAETAKMYNVLYQGTYVYETTEELFALGDLIVSIDGNEVGSYEDVSELLNNYEVGDVVEVYVIRGGEEITLDITLKSRNGL